MAKGIGKYNFSSHISLKAVVVVFRDILLKNWLQRKKIMKETDKNSIEEKKIFSGELALVLGLLINSFSITLYAKSDVGMTTISLIAYVLSLISFISLGTWSYIIQCFMVVVLVVLLKKVKPGYIISFALAVIYGMLIDFFYLFVIKLPDTMLLHALYYLSGFCGLAFGTTLLFKCRIPVLPFDTFTREVSIHFNISYRKIRTCFDISFLICSALLGLYYMGSLKGIGVGTVINSAFMGMAVSKISDLLDKKYCFKPNITRLGQLSD